jgi:hypothetical protein
MWCGHSSFNKGTKSLEGGDVIETLCCSGQQGGAECANSAVRPQLLRSTAGEPTPRLLNSQYLNNSYLF